MPPSRVLAALILATGLAAPQPAAADEAFFMPVADVYPMPGMGMVATGRIVEGSVKVGDKVELVGMRPSMRVTVKVVQVGSAPSTSAKAGDTVDLLLGGVDEGAIVRGQVLATSDSVSAHSRLTAKITLAATGGRKSAIQDAYRPLLTIWTESVGATFHMDAPVSPGATAPVRIMLDQPAAVRAGDNFDIREGSALVGTGVVETVED